MFVTGFCCHVQVGEFHLRKVEKTFDLDLCLFSCGDVGAAMLSSSSSESEAPDFSADSPVREPSGNVATEANAVPIGGEATGTTKTETVVTEVKTESREEGLCRSLVGLRESPMLLRPQPTSRSTSRRGFSLLPISFRARMMS